MLSRVKGLGHAGTSIAAGKECSAHSCAPCCMLYVRPARLQHTVHVAALQATSPPCTGMTLHAARVALPRFLFCRLQLLLSTAFKVCCVFERALSVLAVCSAVTP